MVGGATSPPMTKILGIVLILAGGLFLWAGINRQDSLVGKADSAGTSIANSVDGGTRTPTHTIYLVGGAALALVGLIVAVRPSRPPI